MDAMDYVPGSLNTWQSRNARRVMAARAEARADRDTRAASPQPTPTLGEVICYFECIDGAFPGSAAYGQRATPRPDVEPGRPDTHPAVNAFVSAVKRVYGGATRLTLTLCHEIRADFCGDLGGGEADCLPLPDVTERMKEPRERERREPPREEPLKASRVEMIIDKDILAIVQSNDSTDNKMRRICAIDRAYVGKNSPWWAEFLGVKPQSITKSDFWTIDRRKLCGPD